MIFYENENGLKGQYNPAQGKRSVALGWKMDTKIVRVRTFIKEKLLFRTREMAFCFPIMMFCNSVRNDFFALFIESSRTVFFCLLYPGRLPVLPGLPRAELHWPFRPGNIRP
jgi:hypothetical protein